LFTTVFLCFVFGLLRLLGSFQKTPSQHPEKKPGKLQCIATYYLYCSPRIVEKQAWKGAY
jgi:hypothetical protein